MRALLPAVSVLALVALGACGESEPDPRERLPDSLQVAER